MDDDDKARRNLVIASGVVLLCWVIGLPLESLAERLLGVSPSSTTTKLVPWRVWTVALLVLGYLSLRFRFAKDTAETVDELKKEWSQLVEVILGAETSPRTHAHALDFVKLLGKTAVVVNDVHLATASVLSSSTLCHVYLISIVPRRTRSLPSLLPRVTLSRLPSPPGQKPISTVYEPAGVVMSGTSTS